MKNARHLRVLGAVMALGLAVSACSGSDAGSDPGTEEAAEAAATGGEDDGEAAEGGDDGGGSDDTVIRFAFAPDPVWDSNPDASVTATPCCWAASTTARASGCSEGASAAAAKHSSSCSSWPGRVSRWRTVGRPTVRVPVLSSTIRRTSRKVWKASPVRITMPASAAAPSL